jgi:hypothetical protein
VKSIDTEKKTVTFLTAHASRWTLETIWKDGISYYVGDTGYRPSADGFQVSNNDASLINPDGECVGMSLFSQWYYTYMKETRGDFFPKYMYPVGKDAKGGDLTGQDVIATRADTAVDQNTPRRMVYLNEALDTTDEHRWNYIVSALFTTKLPVPPSLKQHPYDYDKKTFGYGHAVLAYKVDPVNGELFIYDPNRPRNDTVKIEYDSQNKKFRTYAYGDKSYTWFLLSGEGGGLRSSRIVGQPP